MRKNNTDHLWSLGFLRMCLANFLLFASVYSLFPLLPSVMVQRLGVSAGQVGEMFLFFVAAMFLVGPFHAYLGDEYKRKHVLVYSTLAMLGTTLGYLFVDAYPKLLLLAAVQGASFGLATTAGITVAIDITTSARRSAGNMVYAFAARLGMLVGAGLGVWLYRFEGFSMVAYFAVLCGLCSLLFSLRVYVAFRAPIGVSLCNLDRFLLLRGWVPALNLLLVAFLPGVALPLMEQGRYGALFFLAVLVAVTVPFTKIFVKLSHHCQRGTANTTCHLFMDAGLLIGLAVCCLLSDGSSSQFDFDLDCYFIYKIIGIIASVSLLFYFLLTYPYYKRKRVR